MRHLQVGLILTLLLIPLFALSEQVFVTKTGSKYHTASCKYLKWSKIPIEKSDAVRMGFAYCSVCLTKSRDNQPHGIISAALNNPKSYLTAIIAVTSVGLIFYFARKRRTNLNRAQANKIELTELEISFIRKLLLDNVGIDTYDLNEFLGLKDKSMDAQRKTRARFLKLLNEKLYQLHQINDGIQRVTDKNDKRIVKYIINPSYLHLMKDMFGF